MTPRHRLPRSEILRGYRVFSAIFRQRRYIDSELIRCYYFHESTIPPGSISVGFAVRNANNAVTRNRVRRLLREAYRLNKTGISELCRGSDLRISCVFLADAVRLTTDVEFASVQTSIQYILHALCRKLFPSEQE